jgi:hypothetical protein
MARKLLLRTVRIGANGVESSAFVYGEMMEALLRQKPPGHGGLTLDEVLRSLDAIKPIRVAMEASAEEVVLTEDDWKLLVERLNVFSFVVADEAIAEFGLMIRNAPEMGTEISPIPDHSTRSSHGKGQTVNQRPN